MVSSLFRSDAVSSKMRKRFSLPAYTNKPLYTAEQSLEIQNVDHKSSSKAPQPPVTVRPQLQFDDEAQHRQAVTGLYRPVNQRAKARAEQTEARPEPKAAASEPGAKRTRSRRSIAMDTLSILSRRLSVVVEPTEIEDFGTDSGFASRQDDSFLQFNGLLYNFEFGSPISRNLRVFEAGTPDAGNSYGRYRPRNPAERAKKSRYSWGGFDLAHRNNGDFEDQEDLIAILEHDESNLNNAAVAAPVEAGPSSHARRKPSPRRSYYQDKRRSGFVVDNSGANSVAIGATLRKGSTQSATTKTKVISDSSSSKNIQAFIPLGNTANKSETPTPEKKRGIIRRVSFSFLFGRRKTDPMVRNASVHHHHTNNNIIRV